MDSLSEKKTH